jgi:prephenate dehydrogenase
MAKRLFDRIAIVGVGLIGGSIGLAVKKKKLASFVTGVLRRKRSAEEALSAGCVDMATLDPAKGLAGADLVVLCSPVSTIVSQMKALRPHLKPGTIVIDVGSSKKTIDEAARKYLNGCAFVGCHPMAGSEKQGAMNAEADLFEGAVCFLTASHPKVETFWKELGAKPVHIKIGAHDRWVAAASHLPHAMAFSLLASIESELKKAPVSGNDLNPSFRALARLAQSDPSLWADIFVSNKIEVVRAAASLENKLKQLRKAIASGNRSNILHSLNEGNRASKKINEV